MRSLTRRSVLLASTGLLSLALSSRRASAQQGIQDQWRFCGKCHSLFFNGYPAKGVCPEGGEHSAIGFNFEIEYSAGRVQELPGRARQYDWRFCNKCMTMFFDGYPDKGACPAGGGHVAQGFMFGLWDTGGPSFPGSPRQGDWRFCNKCFALFFDGYPDKGNCPRGGGHVAQGLNFVLFHRAEPAPPPVVQPRPSISVSVPRSQVFRVAGTGFLANATVNIRVADDFLNPNLFFNTTSDGQGAFAVEIGIPCNPGRLHFSANDGRPDSSDLTGTFWSNTATLSCQ